MGVLKNAKREKFAQAVASGSQKTDAYKAAYPDSKYNPNSLRVRAHKLSEEKEVADRIMELIKQASDAAVMQRQERMEVLTEIARDGKRPDKYRISAIDTLNKMCGEYVQKHEMSVNAGDLAKMAEKVGEILNE